MKIGDKILLYCKEHNMTMMDFSHLIGVDLRIVLNCTCKNTAPCSNIVNTMAEKMGVPVHYLIDDTKKGSYTYEN
jgi:hypothetical protein